jgi:coenzyme F420-0:L-glutamate ligase/coenzyme F420-1:gamma-L-glutamate ligase
VICCSAVEGIGEVDAGDDLAGLLVGAADLHDGDVLVVTSKVVSKAEGRVVTGSKDEALAAETDRLVARRGGTSIVRTRLGLVMAAAGIDASNTEPGTLVLLPLDPDGSARRIREEIAARAGVDVAVLISDTSGRAWRTGQTDIAVGAAGLAPLDDHAGREDGYGNLLVVTAPALADEITAAADLATGKLSRSPAAVLRGLESVVLPRGQHGPGATVLLRAEEHDMFGLGAREAVVHALVRGSGRGFGGPASCDDLVAAFEQVLPRAVVSSDGDAAVRVRLDPDLDQHARGALEERVRATAFAYGWTGIAAAVGPGSADTPLTVTRTAP